MAHPKLAATTAKIHENRNSWNRLPTPNLQERTQSVVMTFVLPDAMVRLKKDGAIEEVPEKSSEKILQQLRQSPGLLAKALAEQLGISSRAVEMLINLLKKDAKLIRVGLAKGGHWQVIE